MNTCVHPCGTEETQWDQQHGKDPGTELLELIDDVGLDFSEGRNTSLGEEVALFIDLKGPGGVASVLLFFSLLFLDSVRNYLCVGH